MAFTTLTGFALEGVVRVELTTEEGTPKYYRFDTADEVTPTPKVSEGQEKEHRVKNRVIASARTEDVLYGFDLKFKDNTLKPEVLAIVDGGTLTTNAGAFVKYEPPVVGTDVSRVSMTVDVYTVEKDTDGNAISYMKFSFPHAKGEAVAYSFKDGEFVTPEFTLHSRAKKTEKPCTITALTSLPA